MKNLSLILNIILLVAITFLFYKVYSAKPESVVINSGEKKEAKIVYVNSDTLLDNYKLFKEVESHLDKKKDSVEKVLKGREENLKREVMNYQERAQMMSDEERAKVEEGLMQKEQQLYKFRDEIADKMMNEEKELNDSINNHLKSYLKVFNKPYGYHFIMGYQRGSGILLASDSLDITKEVLKGLNEEQ